MWAEIVRSLWVYAILFGGIALAGLAFAVFLLVVKLLSYLQPVFSGLWSWAFRNILSPIGGVLLAAIHWLELWVVQKVLWPVGQLCFTFLRRNRKYIFMVLGGVAFWLITAWLWNDASTRPFIPHAIAATIIGLPLAIVCWIAYCVSERRMSVRYLGSAILGGLGGVAPFLAILPLCARG